MGEVCRHIHLGDLHPKRASLEREGAQCLVADHGLALAFRHALLRQLHRWIVEEFAPALFVDNACGRPPALKQQSHDFCQAVIDRPPALIRGFTQGNATGERIEPAHSPHKEATHRPNVTGECQLVGVLWVEIMALLQRWAAEVGSSTKENLRCSVIRVVDDTEVNLVPRDVGNRRLCSAKIRNDHTNTLDIITLGQQHIAGVQVQMHHL